MPAGVVFPAAVLLARFNAGGHELGNLLCTAFLCTSNLLLRVDKVLCMRVFVPMFLVQVPSDAASRPSVSTHQTCW